MIFKGKNKKREEIDEEEEEKFLKRFEDLDIPILILDERWLRIFPEEYKSKEIKRLEKELRQAFQYQAHLTDQIKTSEGKKKQLMDRIIQCMNVAQISENEAKKQQKSQEYIKEINAELTQLESEYEQMPDRIKECNEQLLKESLRICYRRMQENKEQMDEQRQLIQETRDLLQEQLDRKKELQRESDQIFTFMHRIFGRDVVEMFEEFEEIEGEE